ncbi:glycosyltransferase [Pyrobaculum ferrireducens]|uniref:Glycosyl transferase, group 1 n=1 Tax=Pyrobaculum ferrireducens TaxID=1104324 RepID=G7VIC3_9CREN|nr:glycosyltransferase [Pyrobaculum ferrireducens]AET33403.1 glycosyl transferase, group 1 [Pyrobaculum ferrireducens]
MASDVVVVPSLQVAWRFVVIEARLRGKTVMGTRVGGIADRIVDGYGGFLAPPRDPQDITEKILYFCRESDEATQRVLSIRVYKVWKW